MAWIDAGAAESSDTATTTSTTTTTVVTTEASWDGVVAAFFDASCTGCHGTSLQSGGLDLSSYEAAVAGGASGPGIVPGDAGASSIVRKMAAPHPGLLSDEDLAAVIRWIDAGAPEEAATPTTTTTVVTASSTWDGSISALFNPACTGCHGTSGGLDLSSYEAALAGGASGAGFVPGDAVASVLVQKMSGAHPGLLSEEDLELLKAWIDAGATEN
jgi:mono/diheme cytochrome c family protein